jgi:putative spermidine/putrescine transport system permease protein
MAYIISFSQYFLTLLIGGGSVKTLAVVMVPLIYGGDRTIASAYALLFTLSSLIVFGLFELAGKKMK